MKTKGRIHTVNNTPTAKSQARKRLSSAVKMSCAQPFVFVVLQDATGKELGRVKGNPVTHGWICKAAKAEKISPAGFIASRAALAAAASLGLDQLNAHQAAKLAAWLLIGIPYDELKALVKKEFGISVKSPDSFRSFWRQVCMPKILARRRQALSTARSSRQPRTERRSLEVSAQL